MPLSDQQFSVSESTGEVSEPFGDSTIATLDTEGLSDDEVKSEIIDWAERQYNNGNVKTALSALALIAAENINRVD